MTHEKLCATWVAVSFSALAAACGGGGDDAPANDAGPGDAGVADASDASPPDGGDLFASGTRIVAHPAQLGGMTSDGWVLYTDVDPNGHSAAHVIKRDGSGAPVTIATSSGTGKADIRFQVSGHVVFAWTDRGNRVSTLTTWSEASGVVPRGTGVRPGRAAASDDGASVIYVKDVTATTANVVAGPIGGTHAIVGAIDTADDTCWRSVDLAASASRLVARFCQVGAKTFTLRSASADGTTEKDLSTTAEAALYGSKHIVWRETGGVLRVSSDGTAFSTIASGTVEATLSRDESTIAFRSSDGTISIAPSDATAGPKVVASSAARLGALSADQRSILYGTKTEDRGADQLDLYTDVWVASTDGAFTPHALVSTTTSCASCLFDSFSPDGKLALVLDPIDLKTTSGGVGTVHVFDVASGAAVASFGTNVLTAAAIDAARFVILDATPAQGLSTSFAYGISTRTLAASDAPSYVARGAENVDVDLATKISAFSFAGDGPLSGVWVAPLP
jgi:hypothetical protein